MKTTTYQPQDGLKNQRNWPRLEREGAQLADANVRLSRAQIALRSLCKARGQQAVLAAARAAGLAIPTGPAAQRMTTEEKAEAIEAIVAAAR